MRKAVIASLASALLFTSWQAAASHSVVSPRDPSSIEAPRDPHTGLATSPHYSLLVLFSRGIFS